MSLLDEAETLVRTVAPEIENTYFVDAMEYRVPDVGLGVGAYTSYLLDLQLASQLSDRGLWRGEGFAAVFFLDRLTHLQRFVSGAAIHEAAHYLCFPARPQIAGDDLEESSATAAQIFALASEADVTAADSHPPWHRHGADFVRASVHLWHRAQRVQPDLQPWHVDFSSRYYGLDELAWVRVLADELAVMDRVPIREILTTTPPRDFLDLHRLLVGWWKPDRQI